MSSFPVSPRLRKENHAVFQVPMMKVFVCLDNYTLSQGSWLKLRISDACSLKYIFIKD